MGKRVCLYGYSVENNNFVVNEVEAKIVSEVFEKYLSGSTLKTIAISGVAGMGLGMCIMSLIKRKKES